MSAGLSLIDGLVHVLERYYFLCLVFIYCDKCFGHLAGLLQNVYKNLSCQQLELKITELVLLLIDSTPDLYKVRKIFS